MKKLILFCTALLFLNNAFAQRERQFLNPYLANIVDIDGGTFGFIVGRQNTNKYYFVSVASKSSAEVDLSDQLDARFYQNPGKVTATKINKFSVGEFWVYLYSADIEFKLPATDRYYSSLSKDFTMYSFIDNGKLDGVWYPGAQKFTLLTNDKNKVVLNAERGVNFSQGMPVVNEAGHVVGLIGNMPGTSLEKGVMPEVVDMTDIAAKLMGFADCKFFQLVEKGRAMNICDEKDKLSREAKQEAKQLSSDNSVHAFAFGHAFSLDVNMGQTGGNYGVSGGFNLGISPDKGKIKVTLKPRYHYVSIAVNEKWRTTDENGFTPMKYRIHQFDVPLMLEFVIKKQRIGYRFIGIGAGPGYRMPTRFRYKDNDQELSSAVSVNSSAGLSKKIVAEIGAAQGGSRIVFFASYEFSDFSPSDYVFEHSTGKVLPFKNAGGGWATIGIDFAFRWSGKWGLKVKGE